MDEFTVSSVWKELCRQSEHEKLLGHADSLPAISKGHLFVYDTIDSTNTECKRRIENAGLLRDENGLLTKDGINLHKTVVAAAYQSAGRGRLGRPFYSPSQTGIYFSVVYVPEHSVTDPALFTVTAAVGVCRAICKLYKKNPQIKWVNDVYLNGKKVCGILTEGVARAAIDGQKDGASKVEAAIIGIGINIAVNKEMPADLSAKAGGILQAAEEASAEQTAVTRAQLLASVIEETLHSLDAGENVIPEYRSRSFLLGKKLLITPLIGDNTTSYEATAIDVTQTAGLLIRLADGSQKELHSGEVTLH